MQWLTPEPPLGICCLRICRPSWRPCPWPRGRLFITPDAGVRPFLRLQLRYRCCGCCAGSWEAGSPWLDGARGAHSGCSASGVGLYRRHQAGLRAHRWHGVLGWRCWPCSPPCCCVVWQSAWQGPGHALRPGHQSPSPGAGQWSVSPAGGFRPGPDAVRAAVGGAGRSAGGFFHPVACRRPEPLPGQRGGQREREAIPADPAPGRGHHLRTPTPCARALDPCTLPVRRWGGCGAGGGDREPNPHHHHRPRPPTTRSLPVNGWPARGGPVDAGTGGTGSASRSETCSRPHHRGQVARGQGDPSLRSIKGTT